MARKWPNFTFSIGTTVWKVHWTVKAPLVDGEESWASCDPFKKEIKLWRKIPEHERLRYFIHELVHAFNWFHEEEWVEEVAHQMADAIDAYSEHEEELPDARK